MNETRDSQQPAAAIETPTRAQALKTTDLGIDGLAPAVHLGAGGSANVFAAKKVDTGEAVAVKLLRASADSEKERLRFSREQETLQRLVTHDGIVPVLDAGLTDREEPYFLMPLMEGSLQDRIDRDGALDWQTATQLVAQVADAVAFAHEQHVLHRDLKPGNILLDGAGIPRVSDFGIAKLLDSSVSKSSKSLGTPSFMPPERFNGLEATEESDVYGLGATLAALLTGSAPFLTGANDTDVAVMMRVVTEEPPSFEGLDIPDEVRAAVHQSMAKDPADRPASAGEFAAQLRLAIEPHLDPAMSGPVTVAVPRRNITIPDGPITGPEKGWTIDPTTVEENEGDRKAAIWLMAAAVLVIAGVLGFFGLSAISGTPDDTDDVASGVETSDSTVVEQAGSGSAGSEATGTDEGNTAGGDEETSDVAGASISGDTDDGTHGTDTATQPGTSDEGAELDTVSQPGDGDDTGAVDSGGDDGAGTGDDEQDPSTTDPPPPTTTAAPATPVACISASRTAVEVGDSVSFTNCSTAADSYTWDLDGSSSKSTNASTSWSTAGTKTVTLTASGDGGTDTRTVRVTVSETPVPPPEPTACFNASPTSVETGTSVSLSNCSSDATSYSWDFGDGTSSSLSSPSKSWTTAGSKTVRLSVTGPGGSDSITKTITVTEPAEPPTACFSASSTWVDIGESVSFSNCSTDATSYWWTFSDGTSSSLRSPSKSWSTSGTKTVELTATGPGGSHKTSKTITVNAAPTEPAPEACFTASRTTIDKGESVTFTNCSSDASSYSWNFGDGGTSTHSSPTHTYDSEGSFTVTLTAKGDGGEDAATTKITVEAEPEKDTRVVPDRIRCTTHGENDWSWTWTTLPAWVNDYIVVVDGSRVSVGQQPASYRTSGTVSAIIAIDKNDYELSTSVNASSLCEEFEADAPDVPTGVSCKFSNFRWEGDLWTWSETWSWSAVSGISYQVVVETNGSPATVSVGGSSVTTDPSNGQPSSGKSVKSITAVNSDGKTATRNVNPCGNEGGSGWESPTPK